MVVLIGISLTVAGIEHPRFIFQLCISFSEMSIHVFSLFSSWSVVCFFSWLLFFLSFPCLVGSSAEGFLPSKERKARYLGEHPPSLFFSLSLPSVH